MLVICCCHAVPDWSTWNRLDTCSSGTRLYTALLGIGGNDLLLACRYKPVRFKVGSWTTDVLPSSCKRDNMGQVSAMVGVPDATCNIQWGTPVAKDCDNQFPGYRQYAARFMLPAGAVPNLKAWCTSSTMPAVNINNEAFPWPNK